MTHPPELKEQAKQLAQNKLLRREIAELLGVPTPTVVRWLNPELEKRERARARKALYTKKRKCKDCGKRVANDSIRCKQCAWDAQRFWTRERVLIAYKQEAARLGRRPTYEEWSYSKPGVHPSFSSLRDSGTFQNFSELVIAAGFNPRTRAKAKKNRLTPKRRAELRRETREELLAMAP